MKTKLFLLSMLAIATLIACSGCNMAGKKLATYNFSDAQTITKLKAGDKIIYKSTIGDVQTVDGDIIVVQKSNAGNSFQDHRRSALYFSAVYNVALSDPVISFDEYYVTVSVYPNSQVITAVKGSDNPSHTLWTIRMFDGKKFVFPFMGRPGVITENRGHVSAEQVMVDDASGKVTIADYVGRRHFYLKDIKPEQIKGNEIVLPRN